MTPKLNPLKKSPGEPKESNTSRRGGFVSINPQQKQAAGAPLSPLLIVAGAGTGKTTTLTHRFAHLIAKGISPHRICALTFTNKAAGEMQERVRSLIPFHGKSPFLGTFHALGASILRREASAFGRTAEFVIYDSQDSFSVVKKVVKALEEPDPYEGVWQRKSSQTRRMNEKPGLVAEKISEMKNLGAFRASRNLDSEFLNRAFTLYEEKLEAQNAFDFDDLIDKVVRAFSENPAILGKYRSRFDAILVDEYQDLNPSQYQLVRHLAGEHKNLSVVGDDEQLIYGWRYADLGMFFNFEADWPGARVTFLEENYRSTGNIISAAGAVSSHNKLRRPKELWTKNPAGAPVRVVETLTDNDEGAWIADEVQLAMRDEEDRTVAVLYRTNAQSRAIEQAFLRRGIPYLIFGGVKFYERKEIKDILAAVRYAVNPKDEISRERLEKTLTKRRFRDLAGVFSSPPAGPKKFIEKFLVATEYIGYLERNFANYTDRQENIAELLRVAGEYEDVGKFLEEITLLQSTDFVGEKPREGEWYAHLMTIHLAKGLEFDAVYLTGCNEGLLPHERSIDNAERLEEERRLMYVAMTRAKRELTISYYDMPSRFIGEIPPELVEFHSLAGTEEISFGEKFVTLD